MNGGTGPALTRGPFQTKANSLSQNAQIESLGVRVKGTPLQGVLPPRTLQRLKKEQNDYGTGPRTLAQNVSGTGPRTLQTITFLSESRSCFLEPNTLHD